MSFQFQHEQPDGDGNESWHTSSGGAEHNSLNLLSLTQRSFSSQSQSTFRAQDTSIGGNVSSRFSSHQNYYSNRGPAAWKNWTESPQSNSGGNGSWSLSSQPDPRTQWNVPPSSATGVPAETHATSPKGSPMAQVSQGEYGDCFFEAPLAALAGTQNGQAKLDSMAHQNSDGSWAVTFPGDSTKTVTVTKSDLQSYKVTNKTDQLNAIEIAFLKLDNVAATNTGNNDVSKGAPYPEGRQALQLLTGGPVAFDSTGMFDSGTLSIGSTSGADLISDVQSALAANQPMVAGARDIPKSGQDSQHSAYQSSNFPLIGNHEYSVVGYDSKTKQILLRNPWGNMNGTDIPKQGDTADGVTNVGGGEVLMSVDTFRKYFDELDVAGRHQSQNTAQHVLNDFKQIGSDFSQIKSDLIDNKPDNASAAFHAGLSALGDAGQQLLFLGSEPITTGFLGTIESNASVVTNFNGRNLLRASTQTLGIGAGVALGVRLAIKGRFGVVGSTVMSIGGLAAGSLISHGLQNLEKNL